MEFPFFVASFVAIILWVGLVFQADIDSSSASSASIKSAIAECSDVRFEVKRSLDLGKSVSNGELDDMLSSCKSDAELKSDIKDQRNSL